jgi:hypothetical protein
MERTSVPSFLARVASQHRTLGPMLVTFAPGTYELTRRGRHFDGEVIKYDKNTRWRYAEYKNKNKRWRYASCPFG